MHAIECIHGECLRAIECIHEAFYNSQSIEKEKIYKPLTNALLHIEKAISSAALINVESARSINKAQELEYIKMIEENQK
jgi:hypothetical protein